MCPTKLKDNCEANYSGASGGMDGAGMKKNFRFQLWYVSSLCDNLKTFSDGHLYNTWAVVSVSLNFP